MANTETVSDKSKPVLVSTTQGFSILYKEKFLYSKYNPSKTIINTISNLKLLPGTIILCCSPVLDYGIKELLSILPENCLLLGCEQNPDLYNFEKDQTSITDNLLLLNNDELYDLPVIINKNQYTFHTGKTVNFAGKYKRILRIDFSAGIQFAADFYEQLYNACTNAIMTFWTNRITLTHFGRRYSKNFFANLNNLEGTVPVENYYKTISKPIIVCGAGQSIDKGILDFANTRNNYFIICADTALQPLLANNITPDCVFVEEAQHVISKAFIGTQKYDYHLFAALSSLPQLGKMLPKNNISYFTTLYTDSTFITELIQKQLIPSSNKPFGSVGLTAVYYALRFRKNNSVPVYIYGLDFSYSAGVTHGKNTLAHKTRLQSTNKLQPVQNYNACYNNTAVPIKDKQNNIFYTTPVLNNYGKLFNSLFESIENLFDSGDCGITLNIPFKKPEPLLSASNNIKLNTYTSNDLSGLKEYLNNEKKELLRLKDILTGNSNLTDNEIEIEVKKIVQKREYLYLHFPDGYCFNNTQAFLNRIRAELDYFMKYI